MYRVATSIAWPLASLMSPTTVWARATLDGEHEEDNDSEGESCLSGKIKAGDDDKVPQLKNYALFIHERPCGLAGVCA